MFCSMVHRNLEIRSTGTVSVCCVSDYLVKKPDGSLFNINTDNINEIINSDDLKSFKKALTDGVRVSECSRCWEVERAGGRSKRMVENSRDVGNNGITTLDIKPGNLCNLKCRICYSGASSRWAKEEIDLSGQAYPINEWDDGVLKDLVPYLDKVEYIEISGGEPFMAPALRPFLKALVVDGYARNIHVQFHTNATIFPNDLIEVLNQFGHVTMVLSIDGTGEQFEYQRHPAKWDDARSVLEKFKQTKFSTKISHTISAMNIFYLPEFIEWVNVEAQVETYVGAVYSPLTFMNMTRYAKEQVIHKLITSMPSTQHTINMKDGFEWLVEMLRDTNADKPNNDIILTKLKVHDDYRKEEYARMFSEMWRILNAV